MRVTALVTLLTLLLLFVAGQQWQKADDLSLHTDVFDHLLIQNTLQRDISWRLSQRQAPVDIG